MESIYIIFIEIEQKIFKEIHPISNNMHPIKLQTDICTHASRDVSLLFWRCDKFHITRFQSQWTEFVFQEAQYSTLGLAMPHTQLTEMSEFVLKVRQIFFIPLAQGLYNHPSIGPPILDSETAHVISPTTNSKLLSWRGILFSPINYPPLLVRKCDINWTHRLLLLLMMRLLATTAATAAAVCCLLSISFSVYTWSMSSTTRN